MNLIKENKEAGLAFFKIESNTSESVLKTLSSSIDLDVIKGIVTSQNRNLVFCKGADQYFGDYFQNENDEYFPHSE